MISYPLKAAVDSGLFGKIHISTDDPEILSVASGHGAFDSFPRPEKLSDDHTPIMPVLKWVLEEYGARGEHFDCVALVMATAILLKAEDLAKAIDAYSKYQGTKTILSIARYPAPVEWAFTKSDDNVLTAREIDAMAMRSQDLPETWYDAGMFCIMNAGRILGSSGAGIDVNYAGIPIEKGRAVDIDEEEDLVLAEAMIKAEMARAAAPSRVSARPARSTTILTNRFLLRELTMGDVNERYLGWLNAPDIRRFITASASTRTMGELSAYVGARLNRPDVLFLGIFAKDSGEHIGNIKFEPLDREKGYAVLGILIGDARWRGKGVGPEVIEACAQELSREEGIHELVLGVELANSQAIRSYEKAGFKIEASEKIDVNPSLGVSMVKQTLSPTPQE